MGERERRKKEEDIYIERELERERKYDCQNLN